MKNQPQNNKNLRDKNLDNSANKSNMPGQQVPRYRSNEKEDKIRVKSEAGNLARDFGKGDYGSEEARSDAEKGNADYAGDTKK